MVVDTPPARGSRGSWPSARRIGWRPVLTCSVLVVALAALVLAQTHGGRRVTRTIGLSAPSEPYTALSFTDPKSLGYLDQWPHPGSTRLRVGFSMDNHEGHAMSYRWSIAVNGATWARGKTVVPGGTAATVSRKVRVRCGSASPTGRVRRSGRAAVPTSPAQVQVVVSLAQPSHAIDFWMQCHA